MRTPSRHIITVTAVVGALGFVILGGAAATSAYPAPHKLSPPAKAHLHVTIHPQRNRAAAFSDAQVRTDSSVAAKLARALFTGDLATFNSLSAHPKASQQDLNADHERKDTLISGPVVGGLPTQDSSGNLIVHVAATAKAPSGKTANWTLDIAVNRASTKIVSIDAHRLELGMGSGH